MWEFESTKEIFNHPRLTLMEDTVILPSGARTEYLRFGNEKDVVTLIVEKDDKVLLTEEYTYLINKKLLQFVEGFQEKGETWQEAASRELQEEAGLLSSKLEKIGEMLLNHRRSTAVHNIILASQVSEIDASPEETEQITSAWFTRDEVISKIASGQIIQKNALAAWSVYMATRQLRT